MMSHALFLAGLLAPSLAFAAPFSDVEDHHPNAEAIAYVKAEGIVEGYANGTFQPDATINRAEFVKILIETVGPIGTGPSMCFTDFDPRGFGYAEWYYGYACEAKNTGLVDGYPDGTFRGAANINFVEAAKIIVKAFDPPSRWEVVTDTATQFPWYAYPVSALADNHAIPLSITEPDQYITRGEMAEMIFRLKTQNTQKPSRDFWDFVEGTHTYTAPNSLYSIRYPTSWNVELNGGEVWIMAPSTRFIINPTIRISTPKTCPTVPSRTDGIVQEVELGGETFTAYEMNDGAAGTTYNVITFFSQVYPSQCIVIEKAIGISNVAPETDADRAQQERDKLRLQAELATVIKSIVID